jgi:crotonobetainyl-CoA:carnitine CoA-transferase CaiB-like acyl-CoA transferase
VAVEGDDQLTRFVDVVGDASAADAIREHPAEELAVALRRAGISAERVLGAEDLVADAQLAARGFFAAVEHDEWGRRELVGLPWRVDGGPPIALSPPPRFTPS